MADSFDIYEEGEYPSDLELLADDVEELEDPADYNLYEEEEPLPEEFDLINEEEPLPAQFDYLPGEVEDEVQPADDEESTEAEEEEEEEEVVEEEQQYYDFSFPSEYYEAEEYLEDEEYPVEDVSLPANFFEEYEEEGSSQSDDADYPSSEESSEDEEINPNEDILMPLIKLYKKLERSTGKYQKFGRNKHFKLAISRAERLGELEAGLSEEDKLVWAEINEINDASPQELAAKDNFLNLKNQANHIDSIADEFAGVDALIDRENRFGAINKQVTNLSRDNEAMRTEADAELGDHLGDRMIEEGNKRYKRMMRNRASTRISKYRSHQPQPIAPRRRVVVRRERPRIDRKTWKALKKEEAKKAEKAEQDRISTPMRRRPQAAWGSPLNDEDIRSSVRLVNRGARAAIPRDRTGRPRRRRVAQPTARVEAGPTAEELAHQRRHRFGFACNGLWNTGERAAIRRDRNGIPIRRVVRKPKPAASAGILIARPDAARPAAPGPTPVARATPTTAAASRRAASRQLDYGRLNATLPARTTPRRNTSPRPRPTVTVDPVAVAASRRAASRQAYNGRLNATLPARTTPRRIVSPRPRPRVTVDPAVVARQQNNERLVAARNDYRTPSQRSASAGGLPRRTRIPVSPRARALPVAPVIQRATAARAIANRRREARVQASSPAARIASVAGVAIRHPRVSAARRNAPPSAEETRVQRVASLRAANTTYREASRQRTYVRAVPRKSKLVEKILQVVALEEQEKEEAVQLLVQTRNDFQQKAKAFVHTPAPPTPRVLRKAKKVVAAEVQAETQRVTQLTGARVKYADKKYRPKKELTVEESRGLVQDGEVLRNLNAERGDNVISFSSYRERQAFVEESERLQKERERHEFLERVNGNNDVLSSTLNPADVEPALELDISVIEPQAPRRKTLDEIVDEI